MKFKIGDRVKVDSRSPYNPKVEGIIVSFYADDPDQDPRVWPDPDYAWTDYPRPIGNYYVMRNFLTLIDQEHFEGEFDFEI